MTFRSRRFVSDVRVSLIQACFFLSLDKGIPDSRPFYRKIPYWRVTIYLNAVFWWVAYEKCYCSSLCSQKLLSTLGILKLLNFEFALPRTTAQISFPLRSFVGRNTHPFFGYLTLEDEDCLWIYCYYQVWVDNSVTGSHIVFFIGSVCLMLQIKQHSKHNHAWCSQPPLNSYAEDRQADKSAFRRDWGTILCAL